MPVCHNGSELFIKNKRQAEHFNRYDRPNRFVIKGIYIFNHISYHFHNPAEYVSLIFSAASNNKARQLVCYWSRFQQHHLRPVM